MVVRTDVDRGKGRSKRVALFFLDVEWYCLFGLDQQLYSITVGSGLNLNHTELEFLKSLWGLGIEEE
jgi:hypothetical protein